MAVLRPRNRTVYFRISQEEFHQLDTLCKTTEVGRSVSELSREAVRQLLLNGQGTETSHVGETLERVDRKVTVLNDKLEEILKCLQMQQGNAERGGGVPEPNRVLAGDPQEGDATATAGEQNV
jgi:hypothetical protein